MDNKNQSYQPVWKETFQVRSFDIGLNKMMRISSLCSYFQEVAGRHTTHLDVGYKYVQASGMVWVLSKLAVQIKRMPDWRENFHLETWPLGNERVFFRRDYRLTSGDNVLIKAASYWILLDLNTRRPVVIPLNKDVIAANAGTQIMSMPSESIPAVVSGEPVMHHVQYSDLDQNRHVNNARYVEWIFNQMDLDILENKAPSFFAVEYKQEVRAGDTVLLRKARIQESPLTFAIEGCIAGSEKVCVRSKILF